MNFFKTQIFVILSLITFNVSNASTNVGIVNYIEIENKALVSKDIAKQIQERQTKHQAEIKIVQDDVQKKVADIEKSSTILTAKALETKKISLQKELMQIDSNLKAKSEKLELIKNNTLIALNGKIKEIVSSIATKQNFDIVISENSTLYYNQKHDITDIVIKELDAKMPKMKINWEENSKKKK